MSFEIENPGRARPEGGGEEGRGEDEIGEEVQERRSEECEGRVRVKKSADADAEHNLIGLAMTDRSRTAAQLELGGETSPDNCNEPRLGGGETGLPLAN